MRPNKKLKRAQSEAEEIVRIVVVLLVLVSLLFFYFYFKRSITGITPKQICKSSVRMHASQHFADLYMDTLNSQLKCPTQYLQINTRDKTEAMKEFADRMYDCWDMFGQGKLNLFPQESGETINYCVVCHHIQFDNSLEIPASEFVEYLRTHKKSGDSRTYQQFFTGVSTKKEADFQNPLIAEGETDISKYYINTSIPYVTMFTYNKVGYWHKLTTSLVGTAVGVVVGVAGILLAPVSAGASLILASAVIGGTTGTIIGYSVGSSTASDWESNIHLIPYDISRLDELGCNYLPVAQEGE